MCRGISSPGSATRRSGNSGKSRTYVICQPYAQAVRRRSPGTGEGEREGAPAGGPRLPPDAPAVALDDPPADGEPDADALLRDAVTAAEHLEQLPLRQADP